MSCKEFLNYPKYMYFSMTETEISQWQYSGNK